MNSIPRYSRHVPHGSVKRPPVEERASCLTIMEIGEEEAIAWDAIVALRKAA